MRDQRTQGHILVGFHNFGSWYGCSLKDDKNVHSMWFPKQIVIE